MQDDETAAGMNRRGFLRAIFWVLNSLMTLLLAGPAVGYLLTPLVRDKRRQWVEIGPVAELRGPLPRQFRLRHLSRNSYGQHKQEALAWAVYQDGEVMVYSARCTHMGCTVSWDEREGLFVCPCHGGKFDRRGRVVAGPPARDLRPYPIKVEGGKLLVRV